jgi:hypothetical protein
MEKSIVSSNYCNSDFINIENLVGGDHVGFSSIESKVLIYEFSDFASLIFCVFTAIGLAYHSPY